MPSTSGSKYPVYVWIYGGRLSAGPASDPLYVLRNTTDRARSAERSPCSSRDVETSEVKNAIDPKSPQQPFH